MDKAIVLKELVNATRKCGSDARYSSEGVGTGSQMCDGMEVHNTTFFEEVL